MTRTAATTQDSTHSPFAGCAILIAALSVMLILGGFSIATLFRQFNAIAKFTADKSLPVEVSPLTNKAVDLTLLAEKLTTFHQQLARHEPAALTLTADELNLAIAAYEPFRDLRGTLRITAVAGDRLHLSIAFPLNGKPRLARKDEGGWITSTPRYLNATLVASPALLKHEVVLKIDTIEVPGAAVPHEFIEQMSPYRITERYLTDKLLGPAMAQLTQVGICDGKLVFTHNPQQSPSYAIGAEQVDSASGRFFRIFGLAACMFLVLTGGVLVLGLWAKAKQPRA